MSATLTRVLLLGNAVLLAGVVVAWGLGTTQWEAPAAVAPDAATLAAPAHAGHSAPGYAREDILARPLFAASRRPMPVEVAAAANGTAAAEAPPTPLPKLVGVFSDGAGAGAIVLDGTTPRRLQVGQSAGGWTLKEVNTDGAVFADSSGVTHSVQFGRPGAVRRGEPQPAQRDERRAAGSALRDLVQERAAAGATAAKGEASSAPSPGTAEARRAERQRARAEYLQRHGVE